jgi:acetyl esterase/lipase
MKRPRRRPTYAAAHDCLIGQPSRPRRSRRLVPEVVCGLEDRVLMSLANLIAHPESPLPAAITQQVARSPRHGHLVARNDWAIRRNIPFPTVNGQSELLDVYEPVTAPPPGGRPVLIAIHGGGWRRFDKGSYGERIASAFVSKGYVVVAPNYLLSAPGRVTWPINFEDVQAAVRWVRGNAGMLGINPDEIAAIGESAGANLAALLGTASTKSNDTGISAAVDAVVAFSTPTDLAALQSTSPFAEHAAAEFLGGSPQQVPANYAAASPLDQVSAGDPPMFLVHGRQDSIIPVNQSRDLAAALSAAGVRNQLVVVNGGHDLDFPAHYSKLIPQILEFLVTTWKDLRDPIPPSQYHP